MTEGTVASGDKRGKYSHNSAVATCCGLTSSSNWAHPNPEKLGGKWGAKDRAQGRGESDILNSLESRLYVYKSSGKLKHSDSASNSQQGVFPVLILVFFKMG